MTRSRPKLSESHQPHDRRTIQHGSLTIRCSGRKVLEQIGSGEATHRSIDLPDVPLIGRRREPTPLQRPRRRVGCRRRELHARVYTESAPEGLPFRCDAATLARASVWNLTTGASRLDLAASSPFRVSATLEQTISSTWATASKRRENVISQKRTQSTRTVADAVTVLTPLRGVAPAFKTTMSVTVLGTPACPACMVT